jgi:uncharacterized membrane protein
MTPSPFDLRTLLLAKHAQHVVLIHFPIALGLTGAAFDFLGRWTRQRQLVTVAYYNLMAAALAALPAVVTGVLAWQWALEGQKLKGMLLMHLVGGCLSAGLLWTVAILHFRARRRPEAAPPDYCLLLEGCAAAVLAVTAHLGGFVSGVNGG